MKIRNLLVAGLAMALVSSSFGAYTARLWFSNQTTGQSGPGAITASVGDEIWLNFSFHKTNSVQPYLWTLLSVYIDLANTCCMTDAEANTWSTQVTTAFGPSSTYPTRVTWQASDGDMFNNGTDPSDSTQALVTPKGLYALIGVSGTKAQAQNIDALGFFKFHAACQNGSTVEFGRRPAGDAVGIWTSMIDKNSKLVDVAQGIVVPDATHYNYQQQLNWIKCVPEPGTVAAMATGLVGLLALRRRK